ncbi:plasma membrane ascorbate-dependent reductase CYBRD1 isoform X1 [Chironomus tepperi]|uniref:plasma membrane ascorbate-dependent reductase CYBRD1 isoform X1 n=1 Tax=Chironomus tepperi TaxID=113505 RepID=UPI00391EF523
MDNSVSPMPEAPLAMMEVEKTPSSTPMHDVPPPPDKRYDDDEKSTWQCGSWCEYIFVVVTSSILLLSSIVMTVFWVIFYRQGYSLEDPAKQFNFHPTLMIAGYITLAGFSVLLYRICRCCSNLIVKLCHTFFHACAIPCIVLGFLAVFDSKNQTATPHFYSLHSWLGLICMGLFVFQFVIGFFSFLVLLCCENATYKFRSTMVPIHASVGVATFMLAIGAAITGFTEKALNDIGKDSYSTMVEEGIIINSIAIILIALGIIVPFAVRRTNSPASFKVYVTETI